MSGANDIELQSALIPAATSDATHSSGGGGATAKSLFMCLVVDCPFDEDAKDVALEQNPPDTWNAMKKAVSPEPDVFMDDDDYLTNKYTKYHKVIDLIRRLQKRRVDVEPAGMLEKIPQSEEVPLDDPNQFYGYRLLKHRMLISPDGDEIYIKIHFQRKVLLQFAEAQGVMMMSNPYSEAGGAGRVFSEKMEKDLGSSVDAYTKLFGKVEQRYVDKKGKGWGFLIEVPQKMRLGTRLLREAWACGGCGIQIDELRKNNMLIRAYFPLHNAAYMEAYDLDKWGTLGAACSRHPLEQDNTAMIHYFGEKVALYFVWLRKYTLFLRFAAIGGVIAGVLAFPLKTSVCYAAFSLALIIWAAAWQRKWSRVEVEFSTLFGQDIELQSVLVRDAFSPTKIKNITAPDIYDLHFEFPLTLKRTHDGSLKELSSSNAKRHLTRFLITYPVVLLLTVVMLGLMIVVTWWRFEHPSNDVVNYASSTIQVVIAVSFQRIFDIVVDKLNEMENNRTDDEEEGQYILKSFLFYFFSSYFPLFVLMLYPDPNLTNIARLQSLFSQMLIICAAKPMVQNIQELIMPYFSYQLRTRGDLLGSKCSALCTILRCMSKNDVARSVGLEITGNSDSVVLWKETQREEYKSTAEDYLEITLQFGFMAMFASVFPWAPALALLYNTLEIRVDARKLVRQCKRPLAVPAASIGAWNTIFWMLLGLSVPTNAYFVAILSPVAKALSLPADEAAKYQGFAMIQYILGFISLLIIFGRASIPDFVHKTRAKHFLLHDNVVRKRLFQGAATGSSDAKSVPMAPSPPTSPSAARPSEFEVHHAVGSDDERDAEDGNAGPQRHEIAPDSI